MYSGILLLFATWYSPIRLALNAYHSNCFKLYYSQQELSNLMHEKRFHEALSLALTMEKPFHTLTIVKGTVNMWPRSASICCRLL